MARPSNPGFHVLNLLPELLATGTTPQMALPLCLGLPPVMGEAEKGEGTCREATCGLPSFSKSPE